MSPKEILLQVKIKNNLLWARMREMGIYTQSELARQAEITPQEAGRVANFKVQLVKYRGPRVTHDRRLLAKPPKRSRSKWPKYVLKLSKFLRCLPEDILPPWCFDIKQREFEREHSVESILPALVWLEEERLALPSPEEALIRKEEAESIREVLSTLTTRERQVIEKRFGLDRDGERTLNETGDELNITQERVRQIEFKALRKMRHPRRTKKIKDYY